MLSLHPQVAAPDYSDVDLTPDELKAAIDSAKIKKQISLEQEFKHNRRKHMTEECNRPWTFKEQYENAANVAGRIVSNNKPDTLFEIDEVNEDVFVALCWYFTDNKKFEENGYGDLRKGLFLTGNVGAGKTLLMHCFSRNKKQCYDIVPAQKIVDDFLVETKLEDAMATLQQYHTQPKAMLGTFEYYLQREIGLCIDDIGSEQPVPINKWGNNVNAIGNILWYRHINKVPYHLTHVTTNLDGDTIEKVYGTRLRDRLREMVNFLELNGNSRR